MVDKKAMNSKRGNRFRVPHKILEMRLSVYATGVYVFLAGMSRNGTASVSTKEIAESLGISRRQVFKALKELEEKGMIIRERRTAPNGAILQSVYYLTSEEEWNR